MKLFGLFLMGILGLIIMSIIYVGPFALLLYGISLVIDGLYSTAAIYILIAVVLLRIIQPISIITGKDYKIF